MGERVQAYLDEDTYDEVLTIHEETDKPKSRIVGEQVRAGLNDHDTPDFQTYFGQSLFVVGWIVAYYQHFPLGLGVSFIGLGLMIWTSMQHHLQTRDIGYLRALKLTLGV